MKSHCLPRRRTNICRTNRPTAAFRLMTAGFAAADRTRVDGDADASAGSLNQSIGSDSRCATETGADLSASLSADADAQLL